MSIFRQEGVSEAAAAALDNDAAYIIRPIEYVDTSPPLKTSLFDHPERRRLWKAALDSFRVKESDDERKARIDMACVILNEVQVEMRSGSGNSESQEKLGKTDIHGTNGTG